MPKMKEVPQSVKKLYMEDLIRVMARNSAEGSTFTKYDLEEYRYFFKVLRYTIEQLMLEDKEVILTGFMSFSPKYSKPRVMHSGLTGKDYEVPAGMTMKASVSPAFQEEIKKSFLERKSNE